MHNFLPMPRRAGFCQRKAIIRTLLREPHTAQAFQAWAIFQTWRTAMAATQAQPVQSRPATGFKIWFIPAHAIEISNFVFISNKKKKNTANRLQGWCIFPKLVLLPPLLIRII